MKRTLAVSLAIFILASCALAQSGGGAAKGQAAAAKPGDSNPSKQPAVSQPNSNLPSEATMNAFFHRMFGFEQNLVFKVVSIKASPVDGLAEVAAVVNTPNGQQMTKLFVSKDYAIAGELMPFGPDPFARDRTILDKAAFGPTKGPATPAITIMEFGDLECPACKQAQPVIEKLMSDEPKVKLVFQNYPLEQLHPWATKAAAYLDCIARENNDAAWKFIASVYEQQDAVNQQNEGGAAALSTKLNELATAAGVDAKKIAACADSAETKARLERSKKLGDEVAITSTPTFFINGRRVGNILNMPLDVLKSVVDFEISESGK
jgi:protein-disulfide isomerase